MAVVSLLAGEHIGSTKVPPPRALFVLQWGCFSLQYAHGFNRQQGAYRLYSRGDYNFRVNARRKFITSSLHLPCLHIPLRFVVWASVPRPPGHNFRLLIHNLS